VLRRATANSSGGSRYGSTAIQISAGRLPKGPKTDTCYEYKSLRSPLPFFKGPNFAKAKRCIPKVVGRLALILVLSVTVHVNNVAYYIIVHQPELSHWLITRNFNLRACRRERRSTERVKAKTGSFGSGVDKYLYVCNKFI
jgi:hypothetical protein